MKHLHASPESCERFCNVAMHLSTNPSTLRDFQLDERHPRKNEGKSNDALRDTLTYLDKLLKNRVVLSNDMVDEFVDALKSDCKDVKKILLELVENQISFAEKMMVIPKTVIEAV